MCIILLHRDILDSTGFGKGGDCTSLNTLFVVPPAEGGMKKHITDLVEGIEPNNYRLWVATAPSRDLRCWLDSRGVGMVPLPLAEKLHVKDIWVNAFQLAAWLRLQRIQLVHTHGARAGVVGRLAAMLARVPMVVHTVHNFIYREEQSTLQRWLALNVNRALAHVTSRFIAVSAALAQELQEAEKVPPGKIKVIYNGIDLPRFTGVVECTRLRRELGLNPRRPVVGVVARLVPEKGVSLFLLAAAAIKRAVPLAQFLVVGDGPQRVELERQAQSMGLTEATVFAGQRDDVPRLLPQMNVVVVPSLREGLGVAAMEAMAARRAVVAFGTGGLKEVIKDGVTGVLVPPRDYPAMARQVIELLRQPQRAAWYGYKARLEVENRFLVDHMLHQTLGVYRQLQAQRGFDTGEVEPLGSRQTVLP